MAFVMLVAVVAVMPHARSSPADTEQCEGATEAFDHCIIGAGPGGLQLGHLLHTAGRHYRIFEKAGTAGAFFKVYPRHRKLISLNKRFTGRSDAEFNLRHDWNSLLDNNDTVPMTKRTPLRWPPADILVEYLQDFAQPQERAGRIEYNTHVVHVHRIKGGKSATSGCAKETSHNRTIPAAFALELRTMVGDEQTTRHVECGAVTVATGLSVPNAPSTIKGIDLTTGYEDLPVDGQSYEGKSVAVLGWGNAGFETADALAPYANYVHVLPGRARTAKRPAAQPGSGDHGDMMQALGLGDDENADKHDLVSWESRYVGNLRALNAGLLDAYLLKSLDGASADPTADSLVFVRCGTDDKKVCMFKKEQPQRNSAGQVEATITPGRFSPHDTWATAVVDNLRDLGLLASEDPVAHTHARIGVGLSGSLDSAGNTVLAEGDYHTDVRQIRVFASALQNKSLVEDLAEFARRGGTPQPLVYDHVIRCLGWRHGTDFYTDTTRPLMQHNRKYAVMTPQYESVNVPGMFFAGQLAHGKDYRRSAGGFIHGFRYTARALFHVLQARYHSVPWPSTHYPHIKAWEDGGVGLGPNGCNDGDWGGPPCTTPVVTNTNFEKLLKQMFRRINVASGPYQMVGVLGDGAVFRCKGSAATDNTLHADYYEEMPFSYFNERFQNLPRMFWHFGYGVQARSLHKSRTEGTMFQVHVWFYPGDCSAAPRAPDERPPMAKVAEKKEVLKLYETLHTQWDTWELRVRVGEWLHSKIKVLSPGVTHAQAEEWSPGETCAPEVASAKISSCLQSTKDPAMLECLSKRDEAGELPLCRCIPSSQALRVCIGPCWDVIRDLYACNDDAGVVDQEKDALSARPPRPSSSTIPSDGSRRADISWQMWSAQTSTAINTWEGGRVDINMFNNHTAAVHVMHKVTFSTSEEPVLEYKLLPNQGVRFISHERETWQVRNLDGGVRDSWTIDIGNGILQDLVVQ